MAPMLRKPRDRVTVSPGSIAPFRGARFSDSKAVPAATISGAGLAEVTMETAVLLAELLSVEPVLTETALVNGPADKGLAVMVTMALEPGDRLPSEQVTVLPELEH